MSFAHYKEFVSSGPNKHTSYFPEKRISAEQQQIALGAYEANAPSQHYRIVDVANDRWLVISFSEKKCSRPTNGQNVL